MTAILEVAKVDSYTIGLQQIFNIFLEPRTFYVFKF